MDFKKIDKNFFKENKEISDEKEVLLATDKRLFYYGIFWNEEKKTFLRMDSKIADTVSEGVAWLNNNTAGGRLRFSTDSNYFGLKIKRNYFYHLTHMTILGSGGFVLLEETENGYEQVEAIMPDKEDFYSIDFSVALKGDKVRNYILFFPLYGTVDYFEISFKKGSFIGKGKSYKDILPIVYYGSSITQGGCATKPDNSYQAIISKRNNVDFINLGFSGNAKGEENMANYLSSLKCSLMVIDYDYNAPTARHLKETHYNLYKKIRDKNPLLPIIIISAPNYLPNCTEKKERKRIIKDTYLKAVKDGDKNVYFIDGETFFGKKEREVYTVDNCHPNDLGFMKMADKIGKVINNILNV